MTFSNVNSKLVIAPYSLEHSVFSVNGKESDAIDQTVAAVKNDWRLINFLEQDRTGYNKFLNTLARESKKYQFLLIQISNSSLNSRALRYELADGLGIVYEDPIVKQMLLEEIYNHLLILSNQGKRVLVLVPEAKIMLHDTLESLRILTKLEGVQGALLQVILFGEMNIEQVNAHSKRSVEQNRNRLRNDQMSVREQAVSRVEVGACGISVSQREKNEVAKSGKSSYFPRDFFGFEDKFFRKKSNKRLKKQSRYFVLLWAAIFLAVIAFLAIHASSFISFRGKTSVGEPGFHPSSAPARLKAIELRVPVSLNNEAKPKAIFFNAKVLSHE